MNPIVAEWVEKAEGDYATACREFAVKSAPNFDAACYHAQQTIEKLMKGLLISKGVTPPRTHNLVVLHELILGTMSGWICLPADLRVLTLAATQFRYPGSNATKEDASEIFAAMERLRPRLLQLIRLANP